MRQITQDSINAFLEGREMVKQNMMVQSNGHITSMLLHGNNIATKAGDDIEVSFAGWPTPTTKERLNGLCDELGLGRPFHTVKGQLCMNNKPISETAWIKLEWTRGNRYDETIPPHPIFACGVLKGCHSLRLHSRSCRSSRRCRSIARI